MGLKKLNEAIDENRKKRERKKREKERKKRRVKKYGQTELKHARRGILSCMFAVIASFLLVLLFSVSYVSRGDINVLFGLAGLLALALAVMGLRRGIEGLKERNKNYISCKWGIVCNGILIFLLAATFIRGLF